MKRFIIISAIVILVIIVAIVVVMNYNSPKNETAEAIENSNNIEKEVVISPEEIDVKLTKLKGETTFTYIKYVLDNYYSTINENDKEKIDDIIDEVYQNKEIEDKEMPDNYYIDIEDIYRTQQETDLSTNVVNVNIIDKDSLEKVEDELIIRLDLKNLTYSVIPKELLENEPIEGKEFEISKERIEENNNNKLDDADIGDYAIAEFYYDKLKNLSMYDIEKAYEILDETYKNENCSTVEEYQDLVGNLFSEDTKATDYKKRINAYGETMIECKDSNENEYIFTIKDGVNSDIVVYKK